eukprot:3077996-Alexandrium_andersonii.AAC.1
MEEHAPDLRPGCEGGREGQGEGECQGLMSRGASREIVERPICSLSELSGSDWFAQGAPPMELAWGEMILRATA